MSEPVIAEVDFDTWLAYGTQKGWVSEGFCAMHDTPPLADDENDLFEDGGDPCVPALRVWLDNTVRTEPESEPESEPEAEANLSLEEAVKTVAEEDWGTEGFTAFQALQRINERWPGRWPLITHLDVYDILRDLLGSPSRG